MPSFTETIDPHAGGDAAHAAVPLLEDYLSQVAERLDAELGAVAGVGVTFGASAAPVTIGASSQLALEVDLAQYEVGIGPCLHALRTGESLYVPDLAADDRWGEYGPRAAAKGAASCFSVPVLVDGRPEAVLKVYSQQVDGLDAAQRARISEAAQAICGGVALALHLSRQARDLDDRAAAMDRRRTIDLALGMLMQRHRCDAEAAFALLRRRSQDGNVRLHRAAASVVAERDGSGRAQRAPFVRDQQR